MAQHDYVIANDTAANVRSDLNDALSAIVSQNSGATAPSTTYANMLWYDTANNILKMRTEADDAWINVGYLDQSSNAFRILDDTQVVNTSGTQTGLLGDQTEATWETGTSTTESLVSPAKVKAAIEALSGGGGLVPISTATASSDATIEFTLPSSYDSFYIFIEGVVPATDQSILGARLSSDGGSTFRSGISEYTSSQSVAYSSGVDGTGGLGSFIGLFGIDAASRRLGSSSGEHGVSGSIDIALHSSSSKRTAVHGQGVAFSEVGASICVEGGGFSLTTGADDAVQFLMDSGNIESGVFTLYGRAK